MFMAVQDTRSHHFATMTGNYSAGTEDTQYNFKAYCHEGVVNKKLEETYQKPGQRLAVFLFVLIKEIVA
jgi:hypothetical protein